MTLTEKTWKRVAEMERPSGFTLGPYNAEAIIRDPKHLAFTLSRYKFAAKMLAGCRRVIEIGCGGGLGGLMFLNETKAHFTGIDLDAAQIAYAKDNVEPWGDGRLEFVCQDLVTTPYRGAAFDGLVSLDVIEHIEPSEETAFLHNVFAPLASDAVAVIGTPSKLAARYAGAGSREGHVNLFDPQRFVATLESHFRHVFLFSMNDEMVHTGFSNMAHYLIALCVVPRSAEAVPADR